MANKYGKNMIILNIILVLIVLIYAGFRLYNTIQKHNEIESRLNIEFPRLLFTDSIKNVVKTTYYPENWRGAKDIQYVTFEDNTKYIIWIANNVTSENVYFGDIAKKGVEIIKNAGSDTIAVINDNGKYLYTINSGK